MDVKHLTLLLLLSIGPIPSVSSQAAASDPCGQDSDLPFVRAGLGRLCTLAENPKVQAATDAQDGLDLLAKIPPDILLRLPDSTLVDFVALFGESLEQVEENACAQFASGLGGTDWNTKFMQVAVAVDSALAVRWADALEGWVWALVDESPVRTMATRTTTIAFVQDVLARLPAQDLEALDSIRRREQVDPAVSCALARSLYRELAKGTNTIAPALRMLISGEVSLASTV